MKAETTTGAAGGSQVERPVGRLVPKRDDFLAGICVALQCVTASDDGVLWREIVQTAGVEDVLRYAAHVEPDEWELAGFRKYARRELHRSKPRPKPQLPPLPQGPGYEPLAYRKPPNVEAKWAPAPGSDGA